MPDYSRQIRALRDRLGMNQQQFAALLKVSQGTVSRWEKREQIPGLDVLNRIAAVARGFGDKLEGEAPRQQFFGSVPVSLNVLGAVQVGTWLDRVEFDESSQYTLSVPASAYVFGAKKFGLEVRDESCNILYPFGSVLYVVKTDYDRFMPQSGDSIVFTNFDIDNKVEVSVRTFHRKRGGGVVLQSQSTHDRFQSSIELGPNWKMDSLAEGGLASVGLYGLVVGGFMLEHPGRFAVDIETDTVTDLDE